MDAGEQADKIVLAPQCEHGIDQVVANARFLLLDLQAVSEEVQNIALANAHPQAVGSDDLDDAQRSAAKRERVLRSGRLFIDAEKAADRIQLVRQRHRHRHRRGRHFVALPDRLVVIADRVGDRIGQALGAGVVAAHQALQFRELANHFSDEVSLAQLCCLPRQCGIAVRHGAFAGQPFGQFRHALHLVGDSAQLFVERDPLQLLGLIRQRNLAILLPEKASV